MSYKNHPFILGTFILTLTGFITRILGFFYRIFLSHTIGAEGMGIYQLVFPVLTLCMALTTTGIQTAISRFVASKSALKDTNGANSIFLSGCLMSFCLSCVAAWTLYTNAGFISSSFLGEKRTEPLLRLMAFCLPLGTIHSCVTSYYYARKETGIPSILQLLEQIVRIGSSWLAFQILLSNGQNPTPLIAVIGMLCSELVAAVGAFLLISMKLEEQHFSLPQWKTPLGNMKSILSMALPLTANRVLLTALSSLENILIPQRLLLYGLEISTALSAYGVLTGMALPLILFPSTITNSVSVMLLPSVAELQALGNHTKIKKTTALILRCCLLLGIASTLLFFLGAHFLGSFLFHNSMVEEFLRPLAFICPFLYLNGTISSILNGLGKTIICFFHNLIAVSIRIAFVLFIVPKTGIQGYLWGILLGELTLAFLNTKVLQRYLHEQ